MGIILNFVKYDTVHRKEVLSFFVEHGCNSYSVEDVERNLTNIAKSTLYRIINTLVEEEYLKKCQSSSRTCLYQYNDKAHCPYHMHIRCTKCGKVEHLSDIDSRAIRLLVEKDLDFSVSNSTTLEGLCKECLK